MKTWELRAYKCGLIIEEKEVEEVDKEKVF